MDASLSWKVEISEVFHLLYIKKKSVLAVSFPCSENISRKNKCILFSYLEQMLLQSFELAVDVNTLCKVLSLKNIICFCRI